MKILLNRVWRPRTTERALEDVFSRIYRKNEWGNSESRSGRGSTLKHTEAVRASLAAILQELRAISLLDAACGDFNWMQHVDLESIEYTGVDVVPELIERNNRLFGGENRRFAVLDITRDALPLTDVILCRDCFIHLSLSDIKSAINNFKTSGPKFLMATTHKSVRKNTDIRNGEWRSVNLELIPFNFPRPLRLIVEDVAAGKCLGLWRLEDV